MCLISGLLCGLLGYKDFYRQDWLDEILTWQDESGCFKNDKYSKGTGKSMCNDKSMNLTSNDFVSRLFKSKSGTKNN